jgi:WD40 repeat protein
MWEVRSSGYRKLKEQFLFEAIISSIEFSKDGKRMMISHSDNQTISIYDALELKRISTFKLEAKDEYGNALTYFYGSMLSYDGSYILAGDSYTRRIFDIDGKFIRNLSGRSMYTIYQYSKTEF